VIQKVASNVPKPNFRAPTAAKSSASGAFLSNLATLLTHCYEIHGQTLHKHADDDIFSEKNDQQTVTKNTLKN